MMNKAPRLAISVAVELDLYKKGAAEAAPSMGCAIGSDARGGVDLEPLLGQLLDRAVLDGSLDRILEALLELGIALAQADAHAGAEQAAGDGRANHGVVLELGLLE